MLLQSVCEVENELLFLLQKIHFFSQFTPLLNPRQACVLDRMAREGRKGFVGGMTAAKNQAIAKTSKATAIRDLAELLARGALTRTGGRPGYTVRSALCLSNRALRWNAERRTPNFGVQSWTFGVFVTRPEAACHPLRTDGRRGCGAGSPSTRNRAIPHTKGLRGAEPNRSSKIPFAQPLTIGIYRTRQDAYRCWKRGGQKRGTSLTLSAVSKIMRIND